MKIAIEAQRVFRKQKHGMDVVILEIICQLQKIDKENQYYIFVKRGDDRCLQETDNFKIIELDCPSYPLWEQWALPRAVKRVGADILHCTSNTAPLYTGAKLVLTLHDIFFMEPEECGNKSSYQKFGRYYRSWVVPHILPKCEHIITVSYNERQRILDRGLTTPEKLSVLHNGYSSRFRRIENYLEVTDKYTKSKYYLFFGNTDPRKNTRRVIKAFCLYLQQSEYKYPMIITVVSREYVDSILSEFGLTEFKDYFICAGYAPKDDLPYLYNGAVACLNPSLKEGFGIPILEAMACGTPVITSNVSSMPEVAGDGACLVDPTDCDAIAQAMLKIETDNSYRERLIELGLKNINKFSWEITARKLLELYQSI